MENYELFLSNFVLFWFISPCTANGGDDETTLYAAIGCAVVIAVILVVLALFVYLNKRSVEDPEQALPSGPSQRRAESSRTHYPAVPEQRINVSVISVNVPEAKDEDPPPPYSSDMAINSLGFEAYSTSQRHDLERIQFQIDCKRRELERMEHRFRKDIKLYRGAIQNDLDRRSNQIEIQAVFLKTENDKISSSFGNADSAQENRRKELDRKRDELDRRRTELEREVQNFKNEMQRMEDDKERKLNFTKVELDDLGRQYRRVLVS